MTQGETDEIDGAGGPQPGGAGPGPLPKALGGLSGRLLLLTMFFVMLAEMMIYTPSISRFRKAYLEEHIATAHLAALALEATPDNMVSRELEEELLFHAGAYGIVLKHPDRRMLMLSKEMPPKVDVVFDLRQGSFAMWISDAFAALAQGDNRVMRVIGMSPKMPEVIVEVVLDEAPMRAAMVAFSARILQLSVVISLLTAGLVYLSLHRMMVRPMRRIIRAMARFREDPEDISRIVGPNDRDDEIGVAQRELAIMQNQVHQALKQKTRLATLGAAVAKVNHDLRNSLATAVLVSDRLADSADPEVKKVTPRLFNAIDKAVELCSQTLSYVSGGGPPRRPALFHLSELIAEVGADMRGDGFCIDAAVTFEISVFGEREQLFRVFSNLALNAKQAGASRVRVAAEETAEHVVIEITDDGPGLADKARARLFEPFSGSTRDGGTGLGLVIARDIVRAHGGDISLIDSGPRGTAFRLMLPVAAPSLG